MTKDYYKINQIGDEIYHIFDPAMVYCTLILGERSALLFDTCYGLGDLKYTVSKITDLPIIVVNSHGHIDHIGGNWQFESVYIHENDISLAKLHSSSEFKQRTLRYLQEQEHTLNYVFPSNFSNDEFINRKQPEFLLVSDGYVFDIGERELEVVHIPGHTKGGIGLLDKRTKILLAGDSISPFVWMFLEESTSINNFIASLKRLKSTNFDKIIASHMLELLPKEFIDRLILCASNINVDKSEPFYSALAERHGLIYTEGGKPFVSPDFVTIVFSEDKLDK
ncbi:beta-lactamase domain protein [Thermoanaerobacterium thermosaccharolyticum]|uniref:Beta-lactamase domain protein n=1 Tax=Thermoanaerobacterium thermosaccharolyticum TaxID=1517 RepID=A0A223HX80_THETR|nr:MBL fold metallo-hydrolase [Thermoanaerobacterium thermosaccharolyticum]AST57089.1 beta-lactamase domain protein [Thermoanaerobacterium thermosaccharolyticum]